MYRKLVLTLCAAFLIGASGISCTDDLGECPNKLCVMSGGWKLVSVELDGESFQGDFSGYQLVLSNPSPESEVLSSFQRVNIGGGQDSGTWTIENTNPAQQESFKGSVLRLRPSGNDTLREDWEIESFTPREMVLVLHRDTSVKDGPATIRFVLIPF